MAPDNPMCRLTLTQSLFPRSRKLLEQNEIREAIDAIAPTEVRAKYRDLIDFLFCELQAGYKVICGQFYAGRTPPLCKLGIATPERAKSWDALVMGALLIACELHAQHVQITWEEFRDAVIKWASTPHLLPLT